MGKGEEEDTVALSVAPDGTITGPTEVGDYLLMFQKLVGFQHIFPAIKKKTR